jgi:molybdopterin molybdotransferase
MAQTNVVDPLAPERLGGRTPDMISVDEALERIVQSFQPLGEHDRVPILEALGRVLVEDVPADMDVPPFDNTAMDGYAVRAEDVASASPDQPVTLRVVGQVAAGGVAEGPVGAGEAYRILTGAALPPGVDAIVPYEYTDGTGFGGWSAAAASQVADERAVRVFRPVGHGDNVRYRGEDQRRGEVILRAGTLVRPAEVGGLAGLARTQVWVYRRPRVAVLSTGDEVTPVDQPLAPGHIRDVNSYSLAALIRHYGGEPIPLGIVPDQPEAVRQKLLEGVAAGADLILTTGGVSMGNYDVVKDVLQQEGEIAFWSIDLRPGKPLAFARLHGVPVMGLPGNPVSTIVTFELFARPAMLRLAGYNRLRKVELMATALQAISNRSGRENFMRGIVERRPPIQANGEPEWVVRLTGEQGSNILTSMLKANALVRVPRSRTHIEAGERVRVLMLDWPPLE